MRTLVIYYSWTGNNRLLANEVAERLNADLCPVVEKRKRRTATIVLDMLFRREPQIEALTSDPEMYDHVVLVAPVWAGHVAHPILALIKREKASLSDYSFISLCGDNPDWQMEAVARQLSELIDRLPVALAQLPVNRLVPESKRKSVRSVSGYRASLEDLGHFENEISEFCEAVQSHTAAQFPPPFHVQRRPQPRA